MYMFTMFQYEVFIDEHGTHLHSQNKVLCRSLSWAGRATRRVGRKLLLGRTCLAWSSARLAHNNSCPKGCRPNGGRNHVGVSMNLDTTLGFQNPTVGNMPNLCNGERNIKQAMVVFHNNLRWPCFNVFILSKASLGSPLVVLFSGSQCAEPKSLALLCCPPVAPPANVGSFGLPPPLEPSLSGALRKSAGSTC